MQIRLDHVSYIYNKGSIQEKTAVRDVSLTLPEGQFIALAGSTGSGKSTLIQLLNGLKLPSEGRIYYNDQVQDDDKKVLRKLRMKIGLVFQYPEYQLFDETVLKDVSYGPKNMGLPQTAAEEKARNAMRMVGLGEEIEQKSPFDLSGGEKRRAAIAGILAMEPEVLILDEPTAGLDPAGKIEILELIRSYFEQGGITVLMVSHNMDEIAEYAERVIVMDDGKILLDGDTRTVFSEEEILRNTGLSLPQAAMFCRSIGLGGPVTIEEAVEKIYGKYKTECSEI